MIGLGAAGIACCQLLLGAGITRLRGCDKQGWVLNQPITELLPQRHTLRSLIQYDAPTGTIQNALQDAHVVIGLSTANVLKPEDLALMAKDPIVLALANPDPEISPELAIPFCRVYASGRSDYPNQCNIFCPFPASFVVP